MSADLKALAQAVREDYRPTQVDALLAAVEAHECNPNAPSGPYVHEDRLTKAMLAPCERCKTTVAERDAALKEQERLFEDNSEMHVAHESMTLECLETQEDRTLLRGALEALVAGVEDAVLRFLDGYALQLRPDMDEILRARIERARTALKETEP